MGELPKTRYHQRTFLKTNPQTDTWQRSKLGRRFN
jgi:hypothetical protein